MIEYIHVNHPYKEGIVNITHDPKGEIDNGFSSNGISTPLLLEWFIQRLGWAREAGFRHDWRYYKQIGYWKANVLFYFDLRKCAKEETKDNWRLMCYMKLYTRIFLVAPIAFIYVTLFGWINYYRINKNAFT